MSKTIRVTPGAPYAVTLSSGAELSPGQTADVEPDEYIQNHIATGVLNLIETSDPEPKPVVRKTSRASEDASTESSEGESS
jgi:hypothetical protein